MFKLGRAEFSTPLIKDINFQSKKKDTTGFIYQSINSRIQGSMQEWNKQKFLVYCLNSFNTQKVTITKHKLHSEHKCTMSCLTRHPATWKIIGLFNTWIAQHLRNSICQMLRSSFLSHLDARGPSCHLPLQADPQPLFNSITVQSMLSFIFSMKENSTYSKYLTFQTLKESKH